MKNKKVVLGVTGSIAAYKACELASRLTERGATVIPVLTRSAQELIGPATFEGLTGQRCITAMFAPFQNADIEHIAVAQSADLFLIAPATANILAKMAHGIADDWLSTTLLATRAPILVAPAMNTAMWTHAATQANVETLRARGVQFAGPGDGRQACGTVGPGRLIDPAIILEAVLPLLRGKSDFAGRRVLITSGGTHEPIDPVRFVGNRSSGKMGRALALEALARGAEVVVVTGPATAPLPYSAQVILVETAADMAAAVEAQAPGCDVFIAAAAVADYRPAERWTEKRKRDGDGVAITLVENPDILAAVSASRRPGQIVVGFAAETDRVIEHGREKLRRKGLDFIVANEVGSSDSGFGFDGLRAAILGAADGDGELAWRSKEDVAASLFDRIAERLGSS